MNSVSMGRRTLNSLDDSFNSSYCNSVFLTSHNNAPLEHIGTRIACSPGLRAVTVIGSFTVRVQHIGT